MNIYIYNPSSTGGNFEYAKKLNNHYNESSFFKSRLILPNNAIVNKNDLYFLLPDVSKSKYNFFKTWHFLKRSILNPLRFYWYLTNEVEKAVVLFNDFDQLSAPIWSYLFKRIKGKFLFGVILHDPDRTNYPPHPAYASFSMKRVLSIMDFAYYHEVLPDLSYYNDFKGLKYNVPHGLYNLPKSDSVLLKTLSNWKKNDYLLGIIGNIRDEKNYTLAIKSLTQLPHTKLIIAGLPSNPSVSVDDYKKLAKSLDVYDRIFWCIEYLSEQQLSTVIQIIDLALLYYKATFASQSGIINLLAPIKKNVLISKTNSGLSKLAQRFKIGVLVEPDNLACLVEGIKIAKTKTNFVDEWAKYLSYADWNTHVVLMNNLIKKWQQNENMAS